MNLWVPVLSPAELKGLLFGEVFLHTVVGSLDQHVVKAGPLEDVGRGRRHPKRVNGPAAVWFVPVEIEIAPLVTIHQLLQEG